MPRIAAIEYPLGRTFGQPGDREGQLAVLRATLRALQAIDHPGGIECLPFVWAESPKEVQNRPPVEPPIATYLKRHPWDLPKLLRRDPPG